LTRKRFSKAIVDAPTSIAVRILGLVVILVLKAVIVAGISLGLFTPLNPLYAPLQVPILLSALSGVILYSIGRRVEAYRLTFITITLDMVVYFLELAPRNYLKLSMLLDPVYSIILLLATLLLAVLSAFYLLPYHNGDGTPKRHKAQVNLDHVASFSLLPHPRTMIIAASSYSSSVATL